MRKTFASLTLMVSAFVGGLLWTETGLAIGIDLTSGTTGTVLLNQSFNGETRGVDVTVLSASNLNITSMTLNEFNILPGSGGSVRARIYDSTGASLASADTMVAPGFDQSVTIPISAMLAAGSSFRISFFIATEVGGNSADVFVPDGFPYVEPNGLLRMIAAFSIPSDSFPTNTNTAVPMITVEVEMPVVQAVTIDIKPGSDPNGVNPRSKGVIPVAVLGSVDFDATQVDFSTVVFGPGPASPVHNGHVENVNGDGFDDMVFHFKVSDTGIACGDPNATLTGETFGGDSITGTDAVKTAGCNSSGGGAIAMIFLWLLGWAAISRRSRQ